jgi:hypothetical protein
MKIVEVHHIDRKCRATTQHTFPVHWFSPGGACVTDILASRTLTGSGAEQLAALFDRAFLLVPDTDLCGHYPNYGLRCFDDDALTFETTVCLSCANWIGIVGSAADRFRIAHEIFGELSSELQRLIPLSPSEVSVLQGISEMQRALQERYGRNA